VRSTPKRSGERVLVRVGRGSACRRPTRYLPPLQRRCPRAGRGWRWKKPSSTSAAPSAYEIRERAALRTGSARRRDHPLGSPRRSETRNELAGEAGRVIGPGDERLGADMYGDVRGVVTPASGAPWCEHPARARGWASSGLAHGDASRRTRSRARARGGRNARSAVTARRCLFVQPRGGARGRRLLLWRAERYAVSAVPQWRPAAYSRSCTSGVGSARRLPPPSGNACRLAQSANCRFAPCPGALGSAATLAVDPRGWWRASAICAAAETRRAARQRGRGHAESRNIRRNEAQHATGLRAPARGPGHSSAGSGRRRVTGTRRAPGVPTAPSRARAGGRVGLERGFSSPDLDVCRRPG
jgi:hypothetical protein